MVTIFRFYYAGGQMSVRLVDGQVVLLWGLGKPAPDWVWAAAEALAT
jgi:hypothetical protein